MKYFQNWYSIRNWIITGFGLLPFAAEAMDAAEVDSLNKEVYQSIYINPYAAEELADSALSQARTLGYPTGEAKALVNMGLIHYFQGRYERAFEEAVMAEELAKDYNHKGALAGVSLVKGLVAYGNDNIDMALSYTHSAAALFQKVSYRQHLSQAYNNIGVFHLQANRHDSARHYLKMAREYDPSSPYPWINQAKLYQTEKQYQKAIDALKKARQLARNQNNIRGLVGSNLKLGEVYYTLGQFHRAVALYEKAAEMADQAGMLEFYSTAHKYLYRYYQNLNNYKKTLDHYQNYVQSEKALRDRDKENRIDDLLYKYENEKKEEQLLLLREKNQLYSWLSYTGGGGVILIFAFTFVIWTRYKKIKVLGHKLERERNQSERLLLNILPKETANELKTYGRAQAVRHNAATILFADVKNFTRLAEAMSPEDLVYELDKLYTGFDDILRKHEVEKIKTVGDAYICASGLPVPSQDHAKRVVDVALQMQEFVKRQKTMYNNKQLPYFQIRIGIHSGPVVAGVVGKKKFAYDIWGNSVNVAARMEQNSEPGKINISDDTYKLVNEHFTCIPRGNIEVKNKGKMMMYYIEGFREDTQSAKH